MAKKTDALSTKSGRLSRILAVFVSIVLVVGLMPGLQPTQSAYATQADETAETSTQDVDALNDEAVSEDEPATEAVGQSAGLDNAVQTESVDQDFESADQTNSEFDPELVAEADELGVDPALAAEAVKALNESEDTLYVAEDGTAFAAAPDGTLLAGDEARAAAEQTEADKAGGLAALDVDAQVQEHDAALEAIGDISGSGTESDPYLITTPDDLRTVGALINTDSNYANACMTLQNNIDLSSDANTATWTPIGTESLKYSGTFDGGGYTISGLNVVSTSAWYQGLFGFINGATLENFTVAGSVVGTTYLGGVVGDAWASTFRNITNDATVTSSNSSYAPTIGGIAGYARYSTFENCLNTAKITSDYVSTTTGSMAGYHAVGGIVGTAYLSSSETTTNTTTIARCANTGDIITSLSKQGGLVGESYNQYGLTMTDCYNTGYVGVTNDITVSSYSLSVGGMIGYSNYTGSAYLQQLTMTNCYNAGTLMSNASSAIYVGGLVGRVSGTRPTTDYLPLVSNNYCLDSTATYMFGASSSSYATGEITGKAEFKSESEMKDATFAETLGSNWQADTGSDINNGWPYLRWQNSASTYDININVTLENENNNDDADLIALTLTDAATGLAVDTKPGENNSATSASWLLPAVSDGMTYDYEITKRGYTTQSGTITINKSSVDLDIVLEPEAYSQTLIVSPADADVVLTKNGSTTVTAASATTDSTADTCTYVYEGLYNNDALSYKVTRYGYTSQEGDLDSLSYGNSTVTINLVAETSYTAQFDISTPSAYAGATPWLLVYSNNAGDYYNQVIYDSKNDSTVTNDNGVYTYQVTSLDDGNYTYHAYAQGLPSESGTFTISGASVTQEVTIAATDEAWDGTSVDIAWYLYDTSADEFYIGSPAQLAGLSALCGFTATDFSGNEVAAPTFSGKTIYLTDDIDLGGRPWTPIGKYTQGTSASQFAGVFDGNNHTIANMYVGTGSGTLMHSGNYNFGHGLFTELAGTSSSHSIVRNLTFKDSIVDSVNDTVGVSGSGAGMVTGYAVYADVSNVAVEGGSVTHTYYVGGIVGQAYQSSDVVIEDCTNTANVTVTRYTGGGICGYLGTGAIVERCSNGGTVTSTNTSSSYVTTTTYGLGGVVGAAAYQSLGVTDSCNTGNVSGCMTNVAGIIGCAGSTSSYSVKYTISNCYNTGTVTNTASSYGYTNSNGATASGIVGLLGSVSTSSTNVLENCYNVGEISFADDADINTGSSPNYYVGQVIGQVYNATEANTTFLFNSYYPGDDGSAIKAIGRIKSTSGVINIDLPDYDFMYKADDEMKTEEFVSILGNAYTMDNGNHNEGYPILGWQDTDMNWAVDVTISLDTSINDDYVISKGSDGKYQVTTEGTRPSLTVYDANGTPVNVVDEVAIVVDPDTGDYNFQAAYSLPDGTYTYELSKKGYAAQDGTSPLTGSFTVSRGAVDLTLDLTAVKYTFTINVYDQSNDSTDDKTPIDDATVVLASGGSGGERIEPTSVADGVWTYELYNGSYWAQVSKYGYTESTTPENELINIAYDDAAQEILLYRLNDYTLTITATPVEGQFQDSQASLSLSCDTKTWDVQTLTADDTGTVTFENVVAEGTYTYEVRAGGFNKETGIVEVEGDTIKSLTLSPTEPWNGSDIDISFYDPSKTSFDITSPAELAGVAAITNGTATDAGGVTIQDSFAGKTVNLRANIDLADNDWTPIGVYSGMSIIAFSGTFNGNGHVVSGLHCDLTVTGYYAVGGLFGATTDATITGVEVRGDILGKPNTSFVEAAGLVAASTGTLTISECGSEVTINELDMSDMPASTSVAHVASLVGWTRGTTTITSCYSRGTIAVTATASAFVAGLVAYCSATTSITMDACYNTCNMTVTYPEGAINANAGGFIAAPGSCTVAITDSYNAGNVSATYRDAARSNIECAGALIGNAANANSAGKITDTYWLDTSCSKAIGDSFRGVNYSSSKTEEEMKSSDFVDTLNAAATEVGTTPFVKSSFGSWPLLVWERDLVNVSLAHEPYKTVYNDQENFDPDGIQLKLTYSSGDPQIITGGWTVIDGRNLAVGQTSVTIEYMGFSWSVDITVNQVEHPTASDISLEVAGAVSGAAPADEVTVTSEPLSNGYITYYASLVRWTQAGQTFTGATFADATYYRAEIRIDTYYEDDAWYVLPENVKVSVTGAEGTPAPLEVLYAGRADDGRSYTLVCTYAATTSATAGLTDTASHLYYEGDTHANAYNIPLAEDTALTLAIESENDGITETTYSLTDLEQRVLDENIGYENTYTNYVDGASTANTYTGVKLYQFLSEEFSTIYDDATHVTFVTTDGVELPTTTIGDLRQPGRTYTDATDGSDTQIVSDVPWLLAFGRDGAPLLSYTDLLSDATGPLMIISGQNSATTEAQYAHNVCRIELSDVVPADTQPVTFEATCDGEQIDDLNITVTDAFGNVTTVKGNTCDLIVDESYTYTVGAAGYTTVQGTINVENDPIKVSVDLVKVYSGNPSEVEPAADGYYEIYNADQLVWWINNASRSDRVRLMDDVALNDGVTFDKDVSYSWPVEKFGVYDGSFTGTFDGNGHTIYGFYIYRENKIELWENWDGSVGMISDNIPYIGLFGYANGATVKNLGVDGRIDVLDRPDSQYASYMNIGGIFGYGYGVTAENCTTNIGINYTPATGSGTVGGYPYDGWPEVCDTYIGGIIGSGSGATITDCYSRGEAVAGATRSSNVAGIAGRAANGTFIENCYSTMTLAATPYSGSSFTSYQGGITGRVEDNTGGATGVSASVALNPSIDGGDAELSQAQCISGGSVVLAGCLALADMKIINATIADPSLNGDFISEAATTAKSTYTDIGWVDSTGVVDATSGWQFATDAHPRLWWEDLSVSQTPDQLSDTVEVGETKEGTGGFSSSAPPQTFTLNIQVGGHDVCAGKVYTSTELHGMAHTDKVKYSCYTNGGYTPYGRVTNEYIPFDELFEDAGVDFGAGDTLVFGGVSFSYEDYFATSRYYYPNWDSWSDAGDVVAVPTSLVMKSYGGSMYGSGDTYLDMYASQTDYLYAYMICFGMSSISDAEGNLFINQQTAATVSLSADSSAEKVVRDLLADAIARAESDRDSVVVAEDPADVGVGTTFVSEEVMEAFRGAIDAASIVMSDANATNDDVMTAIEDLEAAIAAFDTAKQVGTKAVDFSALKNNIDLGDEWIDKVADGEIVVADSDDGLAVGTKRVPNEVYERLQTALDQAKALYGDSYLTQVQVDEIATNLLAIIQEFEDSIVEVVAHYSVTVEQSEGGKLTVDMTENIVAGTTVTITATPDSGYKLGGISVVGQVSGEVITSQSADDTYTFEMPADNVTVSATWEKEHAIEIEENDGGNVVADLDEAVAGDIVTFTVEPDPGFAIATFSILNAAGEDVSDDVGLRDNGDGTYTFTMPDYEVIVDVTFAKLYEINITKSDGGDVSADKTETIADDIVTITVTPDPGYELGSFSVKDASGNDVDYSSAGNTYTFEMPASDVDVDVTFAAIAPETYTITINKSEGGNVSADKSKAIAGDTVMITVAPEAGYELGSFSVKDADNNDVDCSREGNTYTFEMPASNVTVDVIFAAIAPEEHKIHINETGGGSVSVPAEAKAGDTVTVTVTADEGFAIATFSVRDASGNPVTYKDNGNGTYTFTMPDSDISVDVTFAAVTPEKVTITKDMFEVDTSYAIYDGAAITKTITSNLKLGTDYTVAYANNTAPGSATITITGIGDYEGTLTYTFKIIHYFEDVGATKDDVNEWYFDAVYGMVDLGVITGYNETTFGVNNSMTRAELVTIMWRYCEPDQYKNYNEATAKNTTSLPDNPDGMYYTGAVNWAVEAGVITGNRHEDGSYTFNPDDPVTFEQLATIVARYCLGSFDAAANYPQTALNNGSFTDATAVSDFARGSMSWAIEVGVVTGNNNHNGTYTLSPLEDVARERAVTVIYRSIESGLLKQD